MSSRESLLHFYLVSPGTTLSGYWLLRNTATVRRLVLRKGGKHVSIVSYGLYGKNSVNITVPVNNVRREERKYNW